MTIGSKIKLHREASDMTQEQLASLLGVTKQTVYKYETGIITNIPLDKIEAMAKIFNILPSELPGWDQNNQDDPEQLAKVALFGGDGEVTDAMWEEAKRFAQYVKQREESEVDK